MKTYSNYSADVYCAKYTSAARYWQSYNDKEIGIMPSLSASGVMSIVIKDTDYTSTADFRNSLKDVMLFYKTTT